MEKVGMIKRTQLSVWTRMQNYLSCGTPAIISCWRSWIEPAAIGSNTTSADGITWISIPTTRYGD